MRLRRESGATLVEAAMVIPLLILIVVAILELGLVFKDFLTVSYLSREGARIGALAGNDQYADCAILVGIGELATTGDLERITEIEIYQADVNGNLVGLPNTATFKGGDPSKCTVPPAVDDTWDLDSSNWPPSSRDTSVGATASPDIVGVRIRMTHDWITGLPPFTGTVDIDERTITRLEPKAYE